MMLDLISVRLFLLVAELGNLTRAAEAAGTVQPVVSQRLKTLEARLGRQLVERSPRHVRLTTAGEAFRPRAEALLAAHEAALAKENNLPLTFRIGLSDHATGLGLEPVLKRLRVTLPAGTALIVRTGQSLDMRAQFDAGAFDAMVIRREIGGAEGEVLGLDPLGWRAAEGFSTGGRAALPLATLAPPCGVRAVALRALDTAGRPWTEALIAGSCTALLAAVRAGCGVAPMGRIASAGAADCGPMLRLPALPLSEIVLFARTGKPHLADGARALAASFRSLLD